MNITDAVLSRRSIRSFLNKTVEDDLIKELLEKASYAASGGNLQPWQIFLINNSSMQEFLNFQKNWSDADVPEYPIYPEKLKEPYRTSRFELGEKMYELLGIGREDKDARFAQVMENFKFFGAPCAFFCFIDRQMGPPQWSDLGMFLQTFMLLAKEVGLDTCAQEAWSMKHDSVSQFVNAEDTDMLFCGMAIGYQDKDAQVNKLQSDRRPIEEWAKFI